MAKKKEPEAKPLQIHDGVWYAVGHGGAPYIEECCHCALTHLQEWKIENGKLYFRYTVDEQRTADARKRRKITREMQAVARKELNK